MSLNSKEVELVAGKEEDSSSAVVVSLDDVLDTEPPLSSNDSSELVAENFEVCSADDATDTTALLDGGDPKIDTRPSTKNGTSSFAQSLLSCSAYSFCSVAMVLTNKGISIVVDSNTRRHLPQLSIIAYQCLLAIVFTESVKAFRLIDYPSFNWSEARQMLPLNILFIGMLLSGFLSLVYVSVPMVTVFKNLTNLVTVFGDWYFFSEPVSVLTIIALAIMSIGAIAAGANDLQFNSVGYFWMVMNCLCTSGYTLSMRFASANIKIPRFGMVFYNNLLTVAMLLPFCFLSGESQRWLDPSLLTAPFLLLNTLAGLFGCFLNFASLWCLSTNSATTYAIVGSLNKVPITVFGILFFGAKLTTEGLMFVCLAMLGGVIYAYSKLPR